MAKEESLAIPIAVTSVAAVCTLGVYLLVRQRPPAQEPSVEPIPPEDADRGPPSDGPPPPPPGMPKPGEGPVAKAVEDVLGFLGEPLAQPHMHWPNQMGVDMSVKSMNKAIPNINTTSGDWPDHAAVLYRYDFSGYSEPLVFTGRYLGPDPNNPTQQLFSSPTDDMLSYLASVANTGSPGYWLTYFRGVIRPYSKQDCNGICGKVIGYTGNTGPWFSGRYGRMSDINSAWNNSVLGKYSPQPSGDALVTQYTIPPAHALNSGKLTVELALL